MTCPKLPHPSEPRQMSLIFEPDIARSMSLRDRQAAVEALMTLMLEAAGWKGMQADER